MLTTNAQWAAHAQTMTLQQLAQHYGISLDAARKRNSRIDVHCLGHTYRSELKPMPEGFAEMELGVGQLRLSRQLGVSVRTVRRWSALVEMELKESANARWLKQQKAEFMANWTQRTYTDARKALKVSQKLILKWSMESGARKPEDQEKRREAAKARHAKRQPVASSQYSRESWFGTPDLPIPRDLWVQVMKLSCPVWEMEDECEEQPA